MGGRRYAHDVAIGRYVRNLWEARRPAYYCVSITRLPSGSAIHAVPLAPRHVGRIGDSLEPAPAGRGIYRVDSST